MAVKVKGNIVYEILIVILAVALVGAILYPSKVWKQEAELENVCHARMDAIHQMELKYRLTEAGTFTDSLSLLKEAVFQDAWAAAALDTIIRWENLVMSNELEEIVLQKHFPDELRDLIRTKLMDKQYLGNLAKWDDLQLALITRFSEVLNTTDEEQHKAVLSAVLWEVLIGSNEHYRLVTSKDIPRNIQKGVKRNLSKGTNLYETRYWDKYFKDTFMTRANDAVKLALRTDYWTADQKDEWEEQTHVKANAELDALSDTEKDSIWQAFETEFWSADREKNWMNDRDRLWSDEKDAWMEGNSEVTGRVVLQKWESVKKPLWRKEAKLALPDSLKPRFPVIGDSLWRVEYDSLRQYDFPTWKMAHKKDVDAAIFNIWQAARRETWEEGAKENWVQQETQSVKYWKNVKDRLWKKNKDILWRNEIQLRNDILKARKRLIEAVRWLDIMDEATINEIVDGLELPDSEAVLALITSAENEGRAISDLGLTPLFRNVLLAEVNNCPVTHTAYVVEVIDTSEVMFCHVYCPIIDTSAVMMAYDINPVTKDTLIIELAVPARQKIFGGAEIHYHGDIVGNRRSWDKKGK